MPVIRWILPDPTDLVIQGEEMRLNSLGGSVMASQLGPLQASHINQIASQWGPLILDDAENTIVIAGDETYAPMHPDFTPYDARQRSIFQRSMIAANAVLCTPCGAIVPINKGVSGRLINNFVQSTSRWLIIGVTRDGVGAALGNCAVTMMETGRVYVDGAPVVAQTISDVSGNYSVEVPLNTAYWGLAYKDDTTDGSGASINTLTPSQV